MYVQYVSITTERVCSKQARLIEIRIDFYDMGSQISSVALDSLICQACPLILIEQGPRLGYATKLCDISNQTILDL